MDLSKVVAIALTHGGDIKDYFGESKVPGPLLGYGALIMPAERRW